MGGQCGVAGAEVRSSDSCNAAAKVGLPLQWHAACTLATALSECWGGSPCDAGAAAAQQALHQQASILPAAYPAVGVQDGSATATVASFQQLALRQPRQQAQYACLHTAAACGAWCAALLRSAGPHRGWHARLGAWAWLLLWLGPLIALLLLLLLLQPGVWPLACDGLGKRGAAMWLAACRPAGQTGIG